MQINSNIISVSNFQELVDAVASAEDGDIIEVISNIECTGLVTVSQSKTITIQSGENAGNENWELNQISSTLHFRVEGNSHLILQNITLDGNAIEGGIYVQAGSELIMNEGGVLRNCVSCNYCGVIDNYGTFTMNGGMISNNSSPMYCGGLYNHQGTFTMNGGKIIQNHARGDGGGVYNYQGTVTINDGLIGENVASGDGGGIYSRFGSLTMNGGKISENTANRGGGIYLTYLTTINGGEISGNTTKTGGGGIYYSNFGTFFINGPVKFADNTAGYVTKRDPAYDAVYESNIRGMNGCWSFNLPQGFNNYDINQTGDAHLMLVYNANGGENAPLTDLLEEGVESMISSQIPDRNECRFAGWNTEQDGSGAMYSSDAPVTITENVMLYAQWDCTKPPEDEADLSITKSVCPLIVRAGDVIMYTIIVTNNGPDTAINVVVEDELPRAICSPCYSIDGGDNWHPWEGSRQIISILPPNHHATIRIKCTVDRCTRGEIENIAYVSSSTHDPNMENNQYRSVTIIRKRYDW